MKKKQHFIFRGCGRYLIAFGLTLACFDQSIACRKPQRVIYQNQITKLCSKIESPFQKTICSDRNLTLLFLNVRKEFAEYAITNPDKAKIMNKELRDKRKACNFEANCLQKLFEEVRRRVH